MNYENTFNLIGNVDIYVIDQILKERYKPGQTILDAGCGGGRNLKWFYTNDFELFGIDENAEFLEIAKQNYPNSASNFTVGSIDDLSYNDKQFNHVLCSAVLHFAKSETHFTAMFSELIRVLKPEGTLFIRMASNIGLDGNAPIVKYSKNGQEGTYYLTRERISNLVKEFDVELIEPVKTTNVQDIRAMTTLVFQKNS